MTTMPPFDHDEIIRRISLDLADGYDEELEMEIEDRHPVPGKSRGPETDKEKDYRQDYFRQLFRLGVALHNAAHPVFQGLEHKLQREHVGP